MNENEFVQEQVQKSDGLKSVVEKLKSIKGKRCLVFIHDDPDGLTSGVILKRVVEKSGGEVSLRIPDTMELEKHRIESELKEKKYDALFIVDKATMGYYNEYPSLIKDVIIIDHHPLIGEYPGHCIVYNPSIPGYTFCSTSILCNIIAEALGLRDDFIDLQSLIGLKCDWAIEPATGFVAPFCKVFLDGVEAKFNNILKKRPAGPSGAGTGGDDNGSGAPSTAAERPTMFEVSQRQNTTLLNLIGEFFFALSGGGFQYFYNGRLPGLKDRKQVEVCFDVLESLKPADFNDFGEFLGAINNRKLAGDIYGCFLDDWQKAINMFDNTVFLDEYKGTKIYFFTGNNVPLMPMAGSVKLYQLGSPATFMMVNWLGKEKGAHISFRANTDTIHCGNFAAKLTERMTGKYGNKGIISGGGHIRAAEFRTRSSGVPLSKVMKEFFVTFEEIIHREASQ